METGRRGRGRPRDPAADAAILDAALELWGEVGFERLTMEAVAARAGVAKTTLYRRWGSKVPLLADVATRLAERRVPEPDTGDIRRDLVLLLGRIGDTYTRTAAAGIVADVVGELGANPELAAAFDRFLAQRRAVTIRVLARGVARGDLRGDLDVGTAVELLTGPLYYRLLVTRRPLSRRFAAQLVDLALDGLGATPGTGRPTPSS